MHGDAVYEAKTLKVSIRSDHFYSLTQLKTFAQSNMLLHTELHISVTVWFTCCIQSSTPTRQ